MISLSSVTAIIVYLIVAGCVFGLLHWLLRYIEGKYPDAKPFTTIGHIVLVVLAVLVLIGLLLNFSGAMPGPLFRP